MKILWIAYAVFSLNSQFSATNPLIKTNMYEKIHSILEQKTRISPDLQKELKESWSHVKKLKRNDFLSKEGEIAHYLYFVDSGAMKIYYLHNGKEICAGFAYSNSLICSYPSFISNQPSDYYIQAIKPCTLLGIKRDDFYRIIDKYRELERCWRIFTEEALLGRLQRELEILTLTPVEKFEKLLKRSPHIFNIIPQKYLAAYLGMSPETFSRAKAIFQKS